MQNYIKPNVRDIYNKRLPVSTSRKTLIAMQNKGTNLNAEHIVQAFQILVNPLSSKQQIKNADTYISSCEQSSQFCLYLMKIFQEVSNQRTKFQILVHLKTVIRRNWNSKRKGKQTALSQPLKQQIKSQLLELYKLNWKLYYKQFNQIFKQLSKYQFPANYTKLCQFLTEVLRSLSQLNLEQVLQSQQLLPYLSLVKVVYKQHANRRIQHSAQSYNRYLSGNVQLSILIAGKINNVLELIKSQPHRVDCKRLLQCSRKIDKIILYCLACIVSSLQYNERISELVKFLLGKVETLTKLLNSGLDIVKQTQLNIHAIVQGVSRLQQHFPLLFSPFLNEYLQLLIQLMLHYNFTQQRLITRIIQANTNPIKTFQYYNTSKQFQQGLQFRKGKDQQISLKSQAMCYQVYNTVYGEANVGVFLEKIVGEVMTKYKRLHEEDEIIFEDAETNYDSSTDQGPYQSLIQLLKTLIQKFPAPSLTFSQTLITHILALSPQQYRQNYSTVKNMNQFVLIISNLMEDRQLDVGVIFQMMEKAYLMGDYGMFCRLVRAYHGMFGQEAVVRSFGILGEIVIGEGVDDITIYQCLACLRRFLSDYQSYNFDMSKVGQCLRRILQLINTYKNIPTHLWNLLYLLTQLFKALTPQAILSNLHHFANSVALILQMKNNKNMVIAALGELLQNVLMMVQGDEGNLGGNKETLYAVVLKLIRLPAIDQEDEEYVQVSKYCLWLILVKSINFNICSQSLRQQIINLFKEKKEQVMQQNASLFIQILQQYFICGLIQVSPSDLQTIYKSQIQDSLPDKDIRINIAFFSLLYSHILVTNTLSPSLVVACMQKLKEVFSRVSPSINSLRMLLMLIISYQVVAHKGEKVFGIFGEAYGDYRQWFWVYCWSLQFINNKYAAKVITISILESIQLLKEPMTKKIEQNLPLDKILNFITLYTQPLRLEQALNGYCSSIKSYSHAEQVRTKNRLYGANRSHLRKIRLQVNQTLSEMDLSQMYKQKFGQLFLEWDWGVDDLKERYTDSLVERILKLLNPAS